ncbi:MAG: zinc metalloprotease HtpX [Acidimicrobiia bacterium]
MAFKNTVKTFVLLAAAGGLLVAVGSLVGGASGALIGLAIGLALVGFTYWFSDRLAVRAAGAHEVDEASAPQLHAMVEELAQRANLPKPRVYVSPSPQPNAFATGRSPKHAAVAVTEGLMTFCPPDQVRAVLAHEMAHIRNRDILIGSVAAAIATGISALANIALFAGMFGSSDDDEGQNPFATLLIAFLAPVAATILQLALSRAREFEADRGGAEIIGDGEPLAQALLTLEARSQQVPMDLQPAQASAFIVNPITGKRVQFARLFMTHPPIEERVERLRRMRSPQMEGVRS